MPRLGSIVPKSLPREFKPSLGVIMHECLHLHTHIPVLSSKYIQMLDLNKGLKLPQTNSRVHHNILQLRSDRKRAIISNGQFQEGEKKVVKKLQSDEFKMKITTFEFSGNEETRKKKTR